MARTAAFLDVPPAAVWAVLADATTYAAWVVGCQEVRAVEGRWPDVGAAFHHAFGAGPARVRDRTIVRACEPGQRLELEARAFPLGSARVTFTLEPADRGTHVVMDEEPLRPLALRLARTALVVPTVARNTLTLQRLGAVAREWAGRGSNPEPTA